MARAGYAGSFKICETGGVLTACDLVRNLNINREAAEHETTTISDTVKDCITGLPKYTLELEIIHDGTDGGWQDIRDGYANGTAVDVEAEDENAYGVSGTFFVTAFNESVSPNELHTDSVTLVSSGAVTEEVAP